MTLVTYSLDEMLGEMSSKFIAKWPEDGNAAFFRAMRLAHTNRLPEGQAVMDSALTSWRVSESYKNSAKQRQMIDKAGKRYQALVSDLVDPASTRVRHWASLVAMKSDEPLHEQWYDRWRLGEALLDNNQPALAMDQIAPMLDMNPRLINVLLLTVEIKLAEKDPKAARGALEQAKWALSKADKDFPPLLKANELEAKVAELEGSF